MSGSEKYNLMNTYIFAGTQLSGEAQAILLTLTHHPYWPRTKNLSRLLLSLSHLDCNSQNLVNHYMTGSSQPRFPPFEKQARSSIHHHTCARWSLINHMPNNTRMVHWASCANSIRAGRSANNNASISPPSTLSPLMEIETDGLYYTPPHLCILTLTHRGRERNFSLQ